MANGPLFLCVNSSPGEPSHQWRAGGEPTGWGPTQPDLPCWQRQASSLNHLDPQWRGPQWGHVLQGKHRGVCHTRFENQLGKGGEGLHGGCALILQTRFFIFYFFPKSKLHFCMCCFAVNSYCRRAKHPWDVSGWLLESLVGVCLSIQTAFWNEIPWKSRLCFDYKQKDGWPFFPSIQINSDKQMARSWNCQSIYVTPLVFWCPSLTFVSLHLPNLLWNLLCHFVCWNLPEPFHSKVWSSLTDRVPAFDIVVRNGRWSPDPIGSWLTFTIKANHAINTVMFYFHLNKGHKETRYFRALTPPLSPCAASSHYRLFSTSR